MLISKFIARCELSGYCNNKQDLYNNGLVLYFVRALSKGRSNHNQDHFCVQNVKQKTNLFIPKLEVLH